MGGAEDLGCKIEAARSADLKLKRIRLLHYNVIAIRRLCLLIAEVEGFLEHEVALKANPEGITARLSAMPRLATLAPPPEWVRV